jgi:glycosyltransferase involved in cell wall biosynthesis
MVFLEAQSCGLPVVAFDNAGVPEAVADGQTGFLVPKYAAKPFADAIERLLKNKDLRQQMSRAAQSHIRQNHDLNQNYQKMEKVLQSIIRTPDKRD